MEIRSFYSLPSTQRYLTEAVRIGNLKPPVAVIAQEQYAGVGSRENSWHGEKGNFFASIAVPIAMLPEDLPLSSASIYFSFLMKKILSEYDRHIWLKWPNDLYLAEQKIGGTITKLVSEVMVCGMGINLNTAPEGYAALQCDASAEMLLQRYLEALEKYPKWKQVFSEYQVEFEQNRRFSVHIENSKRSLLDAQLCEDGSLIIDGKRVYSLR